MPDFPLLNANRDELTSHQIERFRKLLDSVLPGNSFWLKKIIEAGWKPEQFQTLEDLKSFPLTTKQELVADQLDNGPYGSNLTYPIEKYSRLHQTSGTTGKPMRWLDTPDSWNWLMQCWAQIFELIGLRDEDRFYFPFSFGPFLGFWAAFDGANRFGNLCISGGGISSEARLRMMLEHEATLICCTPTYGMRLIEIAEAEGIDIKNSAVRGLIVAGEPGGCIPAIRERLTEGWNARVFDHWGMTEIGALAVEEADCPDTLTMLETECIVEILDPQTLEPVPPGKPGELIITNLGRYGSPLIRYRTGDIVEVETNAHPHGRSLMRLKQGIQGRTDDMITIRGNNFYPSAVEAILREFADLVEYRLVLITVKSMGHLKIEAELKPNLSTKEQEHIKSTMSEALRLRLNFSPELVLATPESLPRFEMKGRRLVRETE
ncbi:Phenylacetate-coenzyme A ligase [Polystyrenella longa]|uniref:Phenylacetate-coenzyme A ligase n=1 Tax=Polystyrenella longa TaxID=2528007 RepID=A0A518CPE6_9PLAN|nr:AMP-binding protein [Polystyrenella longa]QDU81083.1 Phenylacetate-coenzyme A ligase [Polystyrenella longa]